ncbi:unnamed protein product [Caenorhabditis angaria]|uniref:Tyrosine-protein kinase n=1 Tax=Caenorhabditis angaria TaxID=860376 RepID=A0A9P1IN96_9PELO|nr:unnamed protein product [Caenorhabditis angaria]
MSDDQEKKPANQENAENDTNGAGTPNNTEKSTISDPSGNQDFEKRETEGLVETPPERKEKAPEVKDIVEDEALFKSLQQLPFYHGFLPREDLRCLLRNDGDYLIRVSEVTATKEIKRDLILSVFECAHPNGPTPGGANIGGNLVADAEAAKEKGDPRSEGNFEGKLRNMVVRRYNGRFGIEVSLSFETINDLLQHYHQSNTSDQKKNRFLRNPVKLHSWEYKHTDIKLGGLLGEGAYGEVRTGILKRKGREVEVAVKLMKGGDLNKVKIREMMKEARLMRGFKHKNVVRFYGVAVDEQPLYILLELVKGGGLNTYLQKNRKETTFDLMNMCLGAAQGLQYLHANNCIHRDIAARNCLYSNDRVVKLSDFGLSRIGNAYKLQTSQKLPIKWLAPETITTLFFTFKTDVYSYGVMCYEIFSEGEEPWDSITNTEAKKNVVSGKHLQIPETCPEKFRTFIYEKVYVKDPKRRVTMDDIVRFMEPVIVEVQAEQERVKLEPKSTIAVSTISTVSTVSTYDNTKTRTKKRNPKRTMPVKKMSHPGNHNMIEK